MIAGCCDHDSGATVAPALSCGGSLGGHAVVKSGLYSSVSELS